MRGPPQPPLQNQRQASWRPRTRLAALEVEHAAGVARRRRGAGPDGERQLLPGGQGRGEGVGQALGQWQVPGLWGGELLPDLLSAGWGQEEWE
jgi:hypothetical protein